MEIILDDQQREAVYTESDPVLVLAGAGSGKTRVLIERIAHLTEDCKVSSSEIMAFTFTRKAAVEIRSRLVERIGNDAYGVTMGSMHAVFLRQIQRFGEMIGLKTDKITVYGDWKQKFLLKELAIEMGLHDGKKYKSIKAKDMDKLFSNFYERGIWPGPTEKGYNLFVTFFQRCRENNALTYGSILVTFKKLLPKIYKYLNIKHLMVDEAQDNDPLQWSIINAIAGFCHAKLFVVGDIDQALYTFRGADPEYLIRNQDRFNIFRIETNYRSAREIVHGANNLIENNKNRLPKMMMPFRGPGGYFSSVKIAEDQDSASIVNAIGKMGKDFEDRIAIISRNHVFLKKIAELMEEAGTDHVYVGKKSALTNSEGFRRIHAFLKLIVNPYDNFSFLLIRELVGLTRAEYNEIRFRALRHGNSHFQEWLHNMSKGLNPFNGTHTFLECIENVCHWCQLIHNMHEVKDFILEWAKDTPQMMNDACDNGTIQSYLEWLATYDNQDEIDEDPKGIQLMTIHASKGLEFPVVIVVGCNNGIFPGKRALGSQAEMEDERRAAYVAWTRAENKLILAVRPEVDQWGKESPASQFIKESKFEV